MGKRKLRITFVVVLIAILGVCIWSALTPREPSYKGRSLSAWLDDYDIDDTYSPSTEAEDALRHIGTNAIPTLLRMLRAKDSPLKTLCVELIYRLKLAKIRSVPALTKNIEASRAFTALGVDAKSAVTDLAKIYDQKISVWSQCYTAVSLGGIGPDAYSALPSLLHGLETTNEAIRESAVDAIRRIHGEPELVVLELAKRLHDPSLAIRMLAAEALAAYGTNARSAVPRLIEMLNDTNDFASMAATNALKQIDPEAAAKAGVK